MKNYESIFVGSEIIVWVERKVYQANKFVCRAQYSW